MLSGLFSGISKYVGTQIAQSMYGHLERGPVVENKNQDDFQLVYDLAKAKRTEELTDLVRRGVCIDVRRGVHTPASLLAEEKNYEAVNILRDQFFANVNLIAIGFSIAKDHQEVKFYQEEFGASLDRKLRNVSIPATPYGYAFGGHHKEVGRLISNLILDGADLDPSVAKAQYSGMAGGYIAAQHFANEKIGTRTLVAILKYATSRFNSEIFVAIKTQLLPLDISLWIERAKELKSFMRIHSLTYEQACARLSPEIRGLINNNNTLNIPSELTEIMITYVAPMALPIKLQTLEKTAVYKAIADFKAARSSRVGLFAGRDEAQPMIDDLLKDQASQARYQLAKKCLAKTDTDDELAFGQELRRVILF